MIILFDKLGNLEESLRKKGKDLEFMVKGNHKK